MTKAINYVKIKTGTYRKNDIVDTVFPILKPLNIGKKGAFITVENFRLPRILPRKKSGSRH